MTRDRLLQEIARRKKSGDLERCSLAFGHDYAYLSQVARALRNNDEMLEDLLYTIQKREEMELQLQEKGSSKQQLQVS